VQLNHNNFYFSFKKQWLMYYFFLIVFLGFSAVHAQDPDSIFMAEGVTQKWQTKKLMATPESVTYHQKAEILYVSNMNGGAQEKNGKGFISKVKANGEIVDQHFITNLNAPKGMAIQNGLLYVSDIDAIKAFEIKTGKLAKSLKAKDAEFLNDLAVTAGGKVIATDMYKHRLYVVKNDTATIFKPSLPLSRPNGILAVGKHCWIGNKNWLTRLNLNTAEGKKLQGETGPIDGLERVAKNRFLTSDWKGRLFLQNFKRNGHTRKKLLDTRDVNHRVADFTYIPDKDLVVVPTFSANRLAAYTLEL
jgi:hypothetical protein